MSGVHQVGIDSHLVLLYYYLASGNSAKVTIYIEAIATCLGSVDICGKVGSQGIVMV